jgi:hypothetical protein
MALDFAALHVSDNLSADAISNHIRRHFAYLTATFLAPLNRYVATLMSSQVLSPGGSLQYANFREEDFFQSLSKHGCSVQFKGQTSIHRHRAQDAFYKAFCRSQNFYSWLNMKLTLEREATGAQMMVNDEPKEQEKEMHGEES